MLLRGFLGGPAANSGPESLGGWRIAAQGCTMATPCRQTRVSWGQPRARPSVALAGNDPVCFLSCRWSVGQFSPPIIRGPAGIVLGAHGQGRPYAGSQSCLLNQHVCPCLCEEQAYGTPWDSPAFFSGPVAT